MPGVNRRHGHAGDGRRGRSPTYNSWRAAIGRCHYPPHPRFPDYGGRGITVCDRWRGEGGFDRFLADVGERPDGKTLDRIDPNGHYEPGNVRWVTPKFQRWNQRDMAVAQEQRQLTEAEYAEPVEPVAVASNDWPF